VTARGLAQVRHGKCEAAINRESPGHLSASITAHQIDPICTHHPTDADYLEADQAVPAL